jgi:hypothetical protein
MYGGCGRAAHSPESARSGVPGPELPPQADITVTHGVLSNSR